MTESDWLRSEDPAAMLGYLTHEFVHAAGVHGVRVKRDPPIATDRRKRLFACACCRMVWDKLKDPRSRNAVEVAEQYADGLATGKEAMDAHFKAFELVGPSINNSHPGWLAVWVSTSREGGMFEHNFFLRMETLKQNGLSDAAQASVLRLVFGNPFRRVELPKAKHEPTRTNDGDPAHGCEICDGEDICTCPWALRAKCLTCGRRWPECQEKNRICPWLTPDVIPLAQACYDLRDASYFKLIWDALEEAGCDNEEIRRALMWEQRCPTCLGKRLVSVPFDYDDDIEEWVSVQKCLTCNGTGWLPIPGEPFCPRGHWVIDLLLGKE